MAVQRIRFRVQDALVILQVQEPAKRNQYAYGESDGEWRDAKAEDLLEVAAFTRAYDALDKTIESLRVSGFWSIAKKSASVRSPAGAARSHPSPFRQIES